MMEKLTRFDLMALETYAEKRVDYRAEVMQHKKNRKVALGPNTTLYFEDRITIQYQIQEMLRIEKIFEVAAIEEEIEAYNPLIPDGNNWKVTFMIEYEDEAERRVELGRLIGIERTIWMQVGMHEKVYSIANEDLTRETEEKTSAIHFLRFQLSNEMKESVKNGLEIQVGVEHENYTHTTGALPPATAKSLIKDLQLLH